MLRFSHIFDGNSICLIPRVLRLSCRAIVILAAALACAGKIRGHGPVVPVVASQELTRCLSVVRAAARRDTADDCGLVRSEANARLVS